MAPFRAVGPASPFGCSSPVLDGPCAEGAAAVTANRQGNAIGTVDARIRGSVIAGTCRAANDGSTGELELVRVEPQSRDDLERLLGAYVFPSGDRLTIRWGDAPKCTRLVFEEPVRGGVRWLFPVGLGSFIAGASLQRPIPVETWFRWEVDGDAPRLHWHRSGREPQTGRLESSGR